MYMLLCCSVLSCSTNSANKPFRRNLDAYIARFNDVRHVLWLLRLSMVAMVTGELLGGHGGALSG